VQFMTVMATKMPFIGRGWDAGWKPCRWFRALALPAMWFS